MQLILLGWFVRVSKRPMAVGGISSVSVRTRINGEGGESKNEILFLSVYLLETKSLFAALSGWGRGLFLFVVAWWGIYWSGILSPVPEFDALYMFACPSFSRSLLLEKREKDSFIMSLHQQERCRLEKRRTPAVLFSIALYETSATRNFLWRLFLQGHTSPAKG